MSNNNCLSLCSTAFDTMEQCNSETYIIDCSYSGQLKEKDLFLKSQVSLADTACDENSPIFHKFQDNIIHDHSFSLTQFNLEDSNLITEEDSICNEYSEKGFCMRGIECTKIHEKSVENSKQSQEKESLLTTLFKQMPEILISCRKRKGHFMK